jgi:predicted DNA-binding transcriptional regulator YafY
MTGFCHLRQEIRWFRVDRIQQLELRSQQFEIDPTFDREAHFADAFQHEVGGIPKLMEIWFDVRTAPYIRERRWHPTQQVEEGADGSLILRFVVRGLQEVKRWVLFYGAGAKVLNPPELVALVTEELRNMNRLYQEDK